MNNTAKRSTSSIPKGMVAITDDSMNPGGYRDPNTGYEFNYKGGIAWENGPDGRRYKITDRNRQAMGSGGVSGGKNMAGGSNQPGAVNAVGDVMGVNGMAPTSTALPTQRVGAVQAVPGMPTMPMPAPAVTPEDWLAISQVQPMAAPQYIPTMQTSPAPQMASPMPIDPAVMAQILQMTPQEYLNIAPPNMRYAGTAQPSVMPRQTPASAMYSMNGTR
jgi:hypothetical protein